MTPPKPGGMLDLFLLVNKKKWTRAILQHDLLPWFLFSNRKKFKHCPPVRKVTLVCEGQTIAFKLAAATLQRQGTILWAFPGVREELVLRAVRYLAVQGEITTQEVTHQGHVCLAHDFSLGQVQKLLSRYHHTFSKTEIDEALAILKSTRFSYSGGNMKIEETVLADFSKGKMCRVILPPRLFTFVRNENYRALNFESLMSLKLALSRRIYEVVMLQHLGADKPPENKMNGKEPRPFALQLSQINSIGGLDAKPMRYAARRVRQALGELSRKGFLWQTKPYTETPKKRHTGGRAAFEDITWHLYLSAAEVSDIIAASSEAPSFFRKQKAFTESQIIALRQTAQNKLP